MMFYPNLTVIAALAKNRVIGDEGTIPWKLPEDMQHFKETTSGSVVIMGWKTFVSLGRKPLPNRVNIVLTRYGESRGLTDYPDLDDRGARLFIASTLTGALTIAKRYIKEGDEIFCIGGQQIYEQMVPLAGKLIISHIDLDVVGSTRFPKIDFNTFIVSSTVAYPNANHPFEIKTYTRI